MKMNQKSSKVCFRFLNEWPFHAYFGLISSDQTISLESYRFQTAWGGGKPAGFPPPQRKSMFWSFWDKSSKWNYPQVGGRGSENLVRLNFWPLFVTKNGILRFSAFGLIKWSLIKNSKWNYPQFRGCGSEHFIRFNFWPLFVTKNGILWLFNRFLHKIVRKITLVCIDHCTGEISENGAWNQYKSHIWRFRKNITIHFLSLSVTENGILCFFTHISA